MTARNIPARLRKQAREAQAQRKADAARRASHPGNPNKLVCNSFTGAKLVRTPEGAIVFVPGKHRTYVEKRSELENPGGKPTGTMPRGLRALDYVQPLPNKKPIATKKESARVPGWAGVVAGTPGDRLGGSATRSTEIKTRAVRAYTGGNASRPGQDARAEGMRSHVSKQWQALHVTK